jgi:hypothetical protein
MSREQVQYQPPRHHFSVFTKRAGPLEESAKSKKLGWPRNQHVQILYKAQLLHQYSFILNLLYFLKFTFYKL